jgi:Tol biopolymer transport system component
LTRLTTNAHDAFPVWSRDGKRIAFVRRSAEFDRCGLFVMNADGSDIRQVSGVETDCSRVSWGPSDRRLAFGGAPEGGNNATLWLVNVDGSGLKRLLRGKGANAEGLHPTRSPNGRRIVFGWTAGRPGANGLASIRPDGSGLHVLVKPRRNHLDLYVLPAFSRDGKRLAFVHTDLSASGRTQLVVSRADGTHRHTLLRLPFNPRNQGTPSWSPNDRSLVFWRVCGQQACISTMPARGGKARVLLRGYLQPYWGPAGS